MPSFFEKIRRAGSSTATALKKVGQALGSGLSATGSAVKNFCQRPAKAIAYSIGGLISVISAASDTAQATFGANEIAGKLPQSPESQTIWNIFKWIGTGTRFLSILVLKGFFMRHFLQNLSGSKMKEDWQAFKTKGGGRKLKAIFGFSFRWLINIFSALGAGVGTLVAFTRFINPVAEGATLQPLIGILFALVLSFSAIDGIQTIAVEQYFLKKIADEISQKSCCRTPAPQYNAVPTNLARPESENAEGLEQYTARNHLTKTSWLLVWMILGGGNAFVEAGLSHAKWLDFLVAYGKTLNPQGIGVEILHYGMISARVLQSFAFGGAVAASFFHRGYGEIHGKVRIALAVLLSVLSYTLSGASGYLGGTSFLNYLWLGIMGIVLRVIHSAAAETHSLARAFAKNASPAALPILEQDEDDQDDGTLTLPKRARSAPSSPRHIDDEAAGIGPTRLARSV